MRVILGVGNPGNRYIHNRHNVGFMLLDYFAVSCSLSFSPSKSDYYFAEGNIDNSNFLLVKPTTYVNNSGIAANQVMEKYSVEVSDLLVVCDDVNLDIAKFRIRASGSDGGHNGISSIIYHLQSENFPRLRIGVGSNFEKGKMAEYVLTDFNKDEFNQLKQTFYDCRILLEDFIRGGIKLMLDTNSRFNNN